MSWMDRIIGYKRQTDEQIIVEFEREIAESAVVMQAAACAAINPQDTPKNDDNNRAVIEFTVDINGELHIFMTWNDTDEKSRHLLQLHLI